jgi:hypothetical protein
MVVGLRVNIFVIFVVVAIQLSFLGKKGMKDVIDVNIIINQDVGIMIFVQKLLCNSYKRN